MFFILSKILSFIIQPLIWVFTFLCIYLFSKNRKIKRRSIVIATMILVLFSNTLLFNLCSYYWEIETIDPTQIEDTFEVAVVLGGMVSYKEDNNLTQFSGNSDRFLNLLPLYFDGRIKKILISGGSGKLEQDEVEANILANYLIKIGVSKSDLILEGKSRNTYENALYSAEILNKQFNKQKILLSTSSSHMRRSIACFTKQGINCIPFAVDQTNNLKELGIVDCLIPSAEVFNKWYWLIHELLGMFTYKVKGYC